MARTPDNLYKQVSSNSRTAKSFSDVAKSYLHVVLADSNSVWKLEPEMWTSLEARLSKMVIKHLL